MHQLHDKLQLPSRVCLNAVPSKGSWTNCNSRAQLNGRDGGGQVRACKLGGVLAARARVVGVEHVDDVPRGRLHRRVPAVLPPPRHVEASAVQGRSAALGGVLRYRDRQAREAEAGRLLWCRVPDYGVTVCAQGTSGCCLQGKPAKNSSLAWGLWQQPSPACSASQHCDSCSPGWCWLSKTVALTQQPPAPRSSTGWQACRLATPETAAPCGSC